MNVDLGGLTKNNALHLTHVHSSYVHVLEQPCNDASEDPNIPKLVIHQGDVRTARIIEMLFLFLKNIIELVKEPF